MSRDMLALESPVDEQLQLRILKLAAVNVASGTSRADIDASIAKVGNILAHRFALQFNAVIFFKIFDNILLCQRMIIITMLL